MERTFVMIKPDGVQRGLIGEIIKTLEQKGYCLKGLKLLRLSEEMADRHYAEHLGKDFYPELRQFITSGPVVAMVWAGPEAVRGVRKLVGATNPLEADPGSIRGRFAKELRFNVVHAADSPESAKREIDLYFTEKELLE